MSTKATTTSYQIFISYRLVESANEAKVLKSALEAYGISTYLCNVSPGDDIEDDIIDALENCQLAIIMGSLTYGQKTSSKFSTFEELQFIRNEKPYFLIKMCDKFELGKTRFKIPESISYVQWPPGTAIPDTVVPGIIQKLASINSSPAIETTPLLTSHFHSYSHSNSDSETDTTGFSSDLDESEQRKKTGNSYCFLFHRKFLIFFVIILFVLLVGVFNYNWEVKTITPLFRSTPTPTQDPTTTPTVNPTTAPTAHPTSVPTHPTTIPTVNPTFIPTIIHTNSPHNQLPANKPSDAYRCCNSLVYYLATEACCKDTLGIEVQIYSRSEHTCCDSGSIIWARIGDCKNGPFPPPYRNSQDVCT